LDNLNKPTWIDNVKKVQKNIMTPEVKKKEIIEKPKPVKNVMKYLGTCEIDLLSIDKRRITGREGKRRGV